MWPQLPPAPPRKQSCLQNHLAQGAATFLRRVIAPGGDELLEMEQTPRAERKKTFVIRFLPQG